MQDQENNLPSKAFGMNFVNQHQDETERKLKYTISKGLGFTTEKARQFRDFRWKTIGKRIITSYEGT